jgi:hypothetical protein
MTRSFACCILLITLFLGCQPTEPPADPALYSPDQRIKVEVSLDPTDSSLSYQVAFKRGDSYVTVVEPSRLGLVAEAADGDRRDFSRGFTDFTASETNEGTEEYEMLIGKRREHEAAYREKTYTVARQNDALTLRFRVFNDGLGFRYAWNGPAGQGYTVQDELTAFNLPTEGQKWLQAYDSVWMYAPSYETFYQNELPIGESAPANKNGWSFPALFHTQDVWLLLSEAALDGTYVGMHLNANPADGQYRLRFPEPNEAYDSLHTRPEITLPWTSPWRVVHLSDSLEDVATSDLVYHLAEPSTVANTDWIKPGKASWSWWYYSDSPQDYNQLTPYVDFAAEMGWEYSLVDANWNRMKDGDLEQLAAYAKDKNVLLLAWYNSGGPHNVVTEEPRDQMHEPEARRRAFAMLRELGVAGVKIDFFQSDKQPVIRQYIDILNDAAEYELLVNFHGCTLPRGWSRTYPHLLSMEAVFGAEAYKFAERYPAYAPTQNTILPFTRNVVGPMDFTPVTLSESTYPALTTPAHELALPVIFESGLLHLADRPEAYRALRSEAIQYLKDVPVVWDETRFVDGYPGDHVILARRSGDTWYLAGIHQAETEKTYEVSLDFLTEGTYTLSLLEDGAGKLTHREETVAHDQPLSVTLAPYGGFVGTLRTE